jgi:1,4-alpha-glucan branching enzyme
MAVMETVKKMRDSITLPRTAEGEQELEFAFSAPGARNVNLAGKFNDWNTSSLPMKKGKDGIWRAKLKLPQGKHEYKYFVDGAWVHDVPGCDVVTNAFGTHNCVITVKGGASRKAA